MSGTIVAAFGLSSSIFNLVTTFIINPDDKNPDYKYEGNKYFEPEIANRLPIALRWLCFIYLVLAICALFLITRPETEEKNSEKKIFEEKIFSNDKNIEKLEENECPSITQGIRTKEF